MANHDTIDMLGNISIFFYLFYFIEKGEYMKNKIYALIGHSLMRGWFIFAAIIYIVVGGLRENVYGENLFGYEWIPELENKIELTAYYGEATKVEIPSQVDGYPIVKIGNAFENNVSIEEIYMPDSVENIAGYAFQGCTNLKKVRFSQNLKHLGIYSFAKCENLKEVILPESLFTLYGSVFYGCRNLERVVIPKGMNSIEGRSFVFCDKLEGLEISKENTYYEMQDGMLVRLAEPSVVRVFSKETHCKIPRGIYMIDAGAFEERNEIEELELPDTLAMIADSGIMGCRNLKRIKMHEGINYIGDGAFALCPNLQELILPEGVKHVKNCLVLGCVNLKKIVIPLSVTKIYEEAFALAPNITIYAEKGSVAEEFASGKEIAFVERKANPYYADLMWKWQYAYRENADGTLKLVKYFGTDSQLCVPDEFEGKPITEIGQFCFYNNQEIKMLVLPCSLKSIDRYAFTNCQNLEVVRFPNSFYKLGEQCFRKCSKLKRIKLPKKVKVIPAGCFAYCKQLSEVEVPDQLKNIHSSAFSNAKKVTLKGKKGSKASRYAKAYHLRWKNKKSSKTY